jgi:transcriptional regulator with GAF, ATPase, and Fis domain
MKVDTTKNFFSQVQEFEKKLIGEALLLARGNQAKAARLLGLRPTTLNSQIQRLGIDTRSFKCPNRPALFEEFGRAISWKSGMPL